jgi:hypothetical protein
MTYGKLRTIKSGWVMSHVIDDICNNARFELGPSYRDAAVSEYDLRTLREKADFFKEPLALEAA